MVRNFYLILLLAYQAPKGTGPRHLVFNSKGNVAYLIGELDGTVTVLGYNKGTFAGVAAHTGFEELVRLEVLIFICLLTVAFSMHPIG